VGQANAATAEIRDVIASNTQTAVLEGAKWTGPVVTWSASDLDAPEIALARQAFTQWSAATGLDFAQTSNSAESDIRIDFGALDTASTGLVGLTSFTSQNGQMHSGLSIILEDPSQDPLIETSPGQLAYSGTGATFEQVLLHELGHALGFADNANPLSIMDYYLSSANQTLSRADRAAAGELYGSGNAMMSELSATAGVGSSIFGSDAGTQSEAKGQPFLARHPTHLADGMA
jgi:hypothetical protein